MTFAVATPASIGLMVKWRRWARNHRDRDMLFCSGTWP